MINRRTFLIGSITVTLLGSPLFSAFAEKKKKRNLVVISLRGGMDGLSSVPPLDTIHNRSPLILNTSQIESWLSDKEVDLIYDDIKKVNYEDILFHKVDKAVNNTKNTNASLIKKFEEVPF